MRLRHDSPPPLADQHVPVARVALDLSCARLASQSDGHDHVVHETREQSEHMSGVKHRVLDAVLSPAIHDGNRVVSAIEVGKVAQVFKDVFGVVRRQRCFGLEEMRGVGGDRLSFDGRPVEGETPVRRHLAYSVGGKGLLH